MHFNYILDVSGEGKHKSNVLELTFRVYKMFYTVSLEEHC